MPQTENEATNEAGMAADDLESDLAALLNRYSAENASDTPDFLLAQYLIGCLDVYAAAVKARDTWHDTEKFQDRAEYDMRVGEG